MKVQEECVSPFSHFRGPLFGTFPPHPTNPFIQALPCNVVHKAILNEAGNSLPVCAVSSVQAVPSVPWAHVLSRFLLTPTSEKSKLWLASHMWALPHGMCSLAWAVTLKHKPHIPCERAEWSSRIVGLASLDFRKAMPFGCWTSDNYPGDTGLPTAMTENHILIIFFLFLTSYHLGLGLSWISCLTVSWQGGRGGFLCFK